MAGDLLRELLGTFSVEAREHLQTINDGLVELERTAETTERDRLLSELFRAAHSLKGAARAVEAREVETVAHDLESQFDMFRSGDLEPGPEAFDAVYRNVDALASRLDEVLGEPPATEHPGDPSQQPEEGEASSLSGNGHGEAPSGPPSEGESAAPPVDEPPRSPPSSTGPRAADETVRVTTSKLDTLVAEVGELHVTQAESQEQSMELADLHEELSALETAWQKDLRTRRTDGGAVVLSSTEPGRHARLRALRERLGSLETSVRAGQRRRAQLAAELQEGVRRMRMLPLATILDAFPRMVRDLARAQGKEIDLVVEGGETEVDRFVLEQIKDPLTHMLRNCVDHAIEKPGERLSAGKPRRGIIHVKATQRGDRLRLEVTDDGIGIDPSAVRRAAVSAGLMTPQAAEAVDDKEALWMVFRPSLSTSPIVTDVSGRGVGLDVVHDAVERLQGTVNLDSRPGEGTMLTLTLPLAVAATRCLLVRAGGQTFAIPSRSVVRIVRLQPEEVGRAGGQEAFSIDGEPMRVASLAAALGIDQGDQDSIRLAVVVSSSGPRAALVVDALAGEQDAVVKGLPRPLVRVPGLAGATLLGTGEVVLVLGVGDVIRSAVRQKPSSEPAPSPRTDEVPAVLVADDSITTRTMEKNILQAAGYRVRVAADGDEAWRLLQQADVQLLISDVTMPGMDGFELTERVRAHKRLRELPVILVTSLASDQHRERGIEVGADAYIVKSSFDQDRLLETVRRLV